MAKRVVLKEGKEKSLLRRHPWIFSGAIASAPAHEEGEILPVYSSVGRFLALAYFHPRNSLAGRVLSFEQIPFVDTLKQKLENAARLRSSMNLSKSCRLVHGEGDELPGFVIDRYNDVLVVQVNTCGIERLKPQLIDLLVSIFQPRSIYEKSVSFARRQEGLSDF